MKKITITPPSPLDGEGEYPAKASPLEGEGIPTQCLALMMSA